MTKEQMEARTDEKVNEIKALCEKLQVTISAEEVMLDNRMIKKVIYYTDHEAYLKEDVIEVKENDTPTMVQPD